MPVDLKSPLSVTHLIHVTGPLHDVLEGSLTRDIIHQEDSLKRDVQRFQDRWDPVNFYFGVMFKNVLNFLVSKILKSINLETLI